MDRIIEVEWVISFIFGVGFTIMWMAMAGCS